MDFVSTQTPSSRVLCLNEGTGLTCCSSRLHFLPRRVCLYLSSDGSDLWKGDEGLGVVGGLQQRDQTEQEAPTPLYLCRGNEGSHRCARKGGGDSCSSARLTQIFSYTQLGAEF